MRKTIVALCVSTSLMMATLTANAAEPNVAELEQKTAALQKQLNAMQQQLASLQQQGQTSASKRHHRRQRSTSTAQRVRSRKQYILGTSPSAQAAQARLAKRAISFPGQPSLAANNGIAKPVEPVSGDDSLPVWFYTQGTPIVTSPYIGVHSQFNGSNLIVNYPFINDDLRLLQQRQLLEDRLLAADLSFPDRPIIVMSGKAEGIGTIGHSYTNGTTSDIDLGSAELNFVAEMNRWITGLIAFDYDGTMPNSAVSNRRIANSRIYLHRGFITIGNLNRFPMWFTIGQQYLPFGRYSSSMVSIPLTQAMARTNARAVVLGYHQSTDTSPYAQLFAFKGDARTNTGSTVNQYGADLGYQFTYKNVSSDFGASYIDNMADSEGIQATGGTIFGGFSAPTSNEQLVHRVPGFDLHGSLSIGDITFLGEWVTATNRYDTTNLSFNGTGAKPTAMNLEGTYNFDIAGKPTSVALGYGQTTQSLALGLPSKRYIGAINYAMWRDTILSLEFKHEKKYNTADTASGTNSTAMTSITDPTIGKSSNTITAQLGVYF